MWIDYLKHLTIAFVVTLGLLSPTAAKAGPATEALVVIPPVTGQTGTHTSIAALLIVDHTEAGLFQTSLDYGEQRPISTGLYPTPELRHV